MYKGERASQEDLNLYFSPLPMNLSSESLSPALAVTIVHDMKSQLKSVTIPVFSGTSGSWKAVFLVCVDKVSGMPEDKLLQLWCYFVGEARLSRTWTFNITQP